MSHDLRFNGLQSRPFELERALSYANEKRGVIETEKGILFVCNKHDILKKSLLYYLELCGIRYATYKTRRKENLCSLTYVLAVFKDTPYSDTSKGGEYNIKTIVRKYFKTLEKEKV
jgi:hypothetical protein